jgi:hypothetical protein
MAYYLLDAPYPLWEVSHASFLNGQFPEARLCHACRPRRWVGSLALSMGTARSRAFNLQINRVRLVRSHSPKKTTRIGSASSQQWKF